MSRSTWWMHGMAAVSALLLLFPLLWMISTSLKTPEQVFGGGWLPHPATWMNYVEAFAGAPLGVYFKNTLIVAVLVTVGQVVTAILAAYVFGLFRFPGRDLLFYLVIGTMMIPIQVTLLPNYLLISSLGWLNTYLGAAAPQLANAFGVFFLRQHLLGFPRELLEAARVDGAGTWRTLWQVVVPVIRSPIVALVILVFVNTWNEYLWPLVVLTDPPMKTLTVGLQGFVSMEGGNNWGPLMAAATLTTLPALLLYLVAQRQIISSFMQSGLK
ncbi:carbohydrate ABC transporter permease [Kyrpidia spormannii]|uniref:Carbohydrate ABC transporter permease n=1 Tax=Kyrpidia spormannii TaxID=2055160 RepID=A0A2K8N4E2_9BACL|nr:carbohydrate ABC transporter permease [Kyrpidia spormannii]ATY84015.1 carbohydrate ABC transporter permease [Kyrpidia spormannii]